MSNVTPNTPEEQAAPHLVEALALPNDTAVDALDRVNRASVGSLRATSSLAYLKGLEKHVAAWLGRIQDRLKEEVAAPRATADMESAFKAGFESGAWFHATFHGFDNAAAQDAWTGFKSRLPPSPVMVADLVEAHKRAMANAAEVSK